MESNITNEEPIVSDIPADIDPYDPVSHYKASVPLKTPATSPPVAYVVSPTTYQVDTIALQKVSSASARNDFLTRQIVLLVMDKFQSQSACP